MDSKLRSSAITEGVQRAPNRAMLRAVGSGDGDFGKPIIGIANGYSTITPSNAGLDVLAHRAEAAVREAGGMPQIFGTITVSDGISIGTEGMKYSLVSREVIADSIETACGAQSMDGVVRDLTVVSAFEAVGQHSAGKIDDLQLLEVERRACPGKGSWGWCKRYDGRFSLATF